MSDYIEIAVEGSELPENKEVKLPLSVLKKSPNIAALLEADQLDAIGQKVLQGYQVDLDSVREWSELMKQALKLTKQVFETKTQPNLEKASNVKYPLISKAAIDFAARVYPELIQGDRVVQAKVIGNDPLELKAGRASRVSKFMSYQLLDKDGKWEDALDSLLHMLPIFGTVFKKIFYDIITKRNRTIVIPPDDVIVNRSISDLESARRITHRIYMYKNEFIERVRAGIFCEVELQQNTVPSEHALQSDKATSDLLMDEDAPIELLEQHCYLDLDDDDYDEPYIVTVNRASGQVVRIVARFGEIEKNSSGEIKRIVPEQYFVAYHFIKNPDGGFYSIGLGSLLAPINESINSVLNQLIDAGTLSNLQSGFIGKGIRLKSGQIDVSQGKWKVLDTATGVDLKNNIFPIPTKEPSPTLFSLLGLLIESGRELASINDVLQGNQPAQNVPATTILTLVEQGLKVYNAVVKRVFRALKQEYGRLFELNRKYLTNAEYQRVLDEPLLSVEADFDDKEFDLIPVADPAVSSDAQRLARARALMEVPTLDPYEVSKRYLQALQFSDAEISKLLPAPDPQAPPPPEVLKTMAETKLLEVEASAMQAETLMKAAKTESDYKEAETRNRESEARVGKMISDAGVNQAKVHIASDKAATETAIKARKQLTDEQVALHQYGVDQTKLIIEAAKAAKENQKPTE